MSSQSTTPPETPSTTPITPLNAAVGLRLTLPTPPSFSAHRARSHSAEPKDAEPSIITPNHKKRFSVSALASLSTSSAPGTDEHEEETKKNRRVSFNQDLMIAKITPSSLTLKDDDNVERVLSPKSPLYKIPQRQLSIPSGEDTLLSPKGGALADPPKAAPSRRPLSLQGPLPSPASPSRFASTAAARGLSIAPSLAKGGAFGSIWSAGIAPGVGAGWISPGLGSARSTLTTASAGAALAKQRGLSVAVVRGGGEVMPVTPGLGSAGPKSSEAKAHDGVNGLDDTRSLGVPDSAKSNLHKRREIILCKFYHTPGLTCTSRPCRFVHALDPQSLDSPTLDTGKPSLSAYSVLTPNRTPDPTSGTFAQAQSTAPEATKTLRLREGIDLANLEAGERVAVEDENGQEVVGHVFLMSGGGSGAGGKSRDKYKTVPCKDFAEGHCPYGDYCSFIHDEVNTSKVEAISASKEEKEDFRKDSHPRRIVHKKSSSFSSALDAWAKAIPKAIRVPAVKVDTTILDQSKNHLSAFAAPFTKSHVKVDTAGEIILADDKPERKRGLILTAAPKSEAIASSPTKPSAILRSTANAWAAGPPTALRQATTRKADVTVNTQLNPPVHHDQEIASKTPTSASHLIPPTSATSFFGTESDPATPFDPLTHRRKVQQPEEEARARAALSVRSRHRTPSNLSNIAFDAHLDDQRQIATPLGSPRDSSFSYESIFSPTNGPNNTPFYPWGMPMSPISPGGDGDSSLPKVRGGLGVIWTPAGWAVQDAAMKHALRGAEIQAKYQDVKLRKPKSYFRTRPCKFFAEGQCPHGDECTYLHVVPVASPDSTSGSSSDNEPFSPVDAKVRQINPSRLRTIPCKFFNSVAGCTNGDACTFLHTKVVPDSAPLVERPRPWRTKPCRHFQLGRCTLEDACHFAHVPDPAWIASGFPTVGTPVVLPERYQPWKKDGVCEAWSKTGRCADGDHCRYKHVGDGGEGNLERLTEEGLERALEEMRLEHRSKYAPSHGLGDEEDEEDDDVEIVTQATPRSPSSLAPSLMAV